MTGDFNLEAREGCPVCQHGLGKLYYKEPGAPEKCPECQRVTTLVRDALRAAEEAAREVADKATDRPDLGIDGMSAMAGALKAADAVQRLRERM